METFAKGITVCIVDGHPLTRAGLRVILTEQENFTVIGEASSGVEALEVIRRLRPNVALIDLALPDIGGMEVIRQVLQFNTYTKTIALSNYYTEASLHEVMRNGASGYLVKSSNPSLFIRAIQTVKDNKYFLDPSLSDIAVHAILNQASVSPQESRYLLTTREREILQLMVRGYSCIQTAELLSISRRTVEVHRYNIRQKLGLRTQVELVSYALQKGLVHLPSPNSLVLE